jgi:tetratricopeptide (TPR) repeat protein
MKSEPETPRGRLPLRRGRRPCAARHALAGGTLAVATLAATPARLPAQSDALLGRAIEHYHAGELAAARRLFELLYAQQPAEPSFLSILSEIERRLRNFAAAEAWAKQAIARAPTSGLGQLALAELYHEYARHREALQFARSAVPGTHPEAPSLVVARELLELGRVDEAVAAVEAAQLEAATRQRRPAPSAMVDPVALDWVATTEAVLAQGTARADDVLALYGRLFGKFPEAFRWLGLANALAEIGDSLRAAVVYDSFALAAPDDALLLTLGTNEAVADGQIAAAAKMIDRLSAAGVPVTTGVLGMGVGLVAFQDLSGLRPVLEKQAEAYPEFPEVWLLLGVARRQAGDSAGAAAAFDSVLALTPDDPGTLAARGQELRSVFAYGHAERAARRALDRDPSNLSALELLALALTDQGRYRDALDARWAVVERDTAEPAHLFGFASLALKVDTLFGADTIRALLPRFGGRHEAALRIHLAEALAALGDTAGAIAQFDSAVAADTTWAAAYSRRAHFRERRRDLGGAIEDSERAFRRDSTNSHQIHDLARLYILAHRFDAALDAARRAHGLDATDWDTHYYLALGLRALGTPAPAAALEAFALDRLARGTPGWRRAVEQALDRDLRAAAETLRAWAAALPRHDAWNWKRLSLEGWAGATEAVARFRRR